MSDSDIDDDILNEILNASPTLDRKKKQDSPKKAEVVIEEKVKKEEVSVPVINENKSVSNEVHHEASKDSKNKLMKDLFLDEEKSISPKKSFSPVKSKENIPKPQAEATKPVVEVTKMNFDDDILSGVDKSAKSKNKSSFMDDLFGKPAGKDSQSNYMDDILGASKQRAGQSVSGDSDFVLDSKYMKNDDKASVLSGIGIYLMNLN